jgi:heme/copper-type cytochrome/quinol oxidase subunit 2
VKIRLWGTVLAALAISVGLITLLGYFINQPTLLALRLQFVVWAGLLAAWAVILGALNLLGVHVKKVAEQSGGWGYSLILAATLFLTVLAAAAAPLVGFGRGPTNAPSVWTFRYLVTGVGTALSGLLVFFLVFAGYRLLRRRPTVVSVTFVVVALISILGMAPQLPELPLSFVRDFWLWIAQVPAVAGARGILLGIALGVIATGLRVLLAVDRPYGE